MRIRTLGLRSFGPFTDLKLTDLDQRLVVICARNEGGKSTLKDAIETLLFGFNPANRDSHPYTCWQGGDMELEGDMVFDDGTDFEVHRKMLASPRAVVTGSGVGRHNIRNRPLTVVDYISREMFRGIYSLSLEDMQLFKGQTWDEVQDRLLSNLGADFLKAPRAVIGQLNTDGSMLWRTDNRGNPRAKVLKTKMRDLKRQRLEAQKRYELIRQLNDERLGIEAQIYSTREEITRLRARVRKATRLNPVRNMLKNREELLSGIGDVDLLNRIPDNAGDILHLLEEQLAKAQDRQVQTMARIKALQGSMVELKDEDRLLLDKKQRIRSMVSMVGLFASDRERMAQLSRQLDIVDDRLKEAADDILKDEWHGGLEDTFKQVSRGELRGRITAYKDARARYDEVARAGGGQLTSEGRADPRPLPAVSTILLFVSGGLLAAGYFIDQDLLKLFAGIGLALSLAHLWSWYRIRQEGRARDRRNKAIRETLQRQLRDASDALKKQRREVLELLKGIPVVPALTDTPDEILYTGIVGIQRILEKKAGLLQEHRSIRDCYHKRIQQVEGLSGQGVDPHLQTAEQRIFELDERLRALEDSIKVSQGAARELAVQKEELKKVEGEIEAIEKKQGKLHIPLRILGGGDLDKGLELAEGEKRDYQQCQKIQEDLERKYPDLKALIEEIEDTPSEDQWILSDEEIVRAQDQITDLTDKLGELQRDEVRLSSEIANLNSDQTLDEIDGLLEVLQEQLDRTLRRRDRLELLKNIILTSDRRFREQHQPDVLKKAGEYLSSVTGGRYAALFFEEQDKEPLLMTKVLDDPYPIPASHPLSRGTLDQIYLSLRLSLMDHLDEGRERLPLSVDEVFVNWDEKRLNNGLNVLEKVQAKRQVFVFTCHKWFADMLRDRFGISILHL